MRLEHKQRSVVDYSQIEREQSQSQPYNRANRFVLYNNERTCNTVVAMNSNERGYHALGIDWSGHAAVADRCRLDLAGDGRSTRQRHDRAAVLGLDGAAGAHR